VPVHGTPGFASDVRIGIAHEAGELLRIVSGPDQVHVVRQAADRVQANRMALLSPGKNAGDDAGEVRRGRQEEPPL